MFYLLTYRPTTAQYICVRRFDVRILSVRFRRTASAVLEWCRQREQENM